MQREAHRSALVGAREGTLLLARASIETLIAGLYWLNRDDSGEWLTDGNARTLKRVLTYLSERVGMPDETLTELIALVGKPRQLPPFKKMTDEIGDESRRPLTTNLHAQLYIPLSELFAHPSGSTLMRHVTKDGLVSETPAKWWPTRFAVHTVDMCVGQLATAIAERTGRDPTVFTRYATAHGKRVFPPALTMFFGQILGSLTPAAVRGIAGVPTASRQAAATFQSLESRDDREAYATEFLAGVFSRFYTGDPESLQRMIAVAAKWFADSDEIGPQPDRTSGESAG